VARAINQFPGISDEFELESDEADEFTIDETLRSVERLTVAENGLHRSGQLD
jgi:hypothetical protein